jgi:glycosyltransferase involved in cell wall biosynthesis
MGEEAGILCPRRDSAALATAMLRVLDNAALAAEIGAAARRRALAYDYRTVAERLADVYSASLGMLSDKR